MHRQYRMNEMRLQTFRNVPYFPAPGMSNWEIVAINTESY